MTLEEQLAFISDVLTYGDLDNGTTALWEDIWWRTDDGYYPVTFLVNCNDLFWWGTADCEPLSPENLPVLKQALLDVREALGVSEEPSIDDKERWEIWWNSSGYATSLFAARIRKMRPQRPCYKNFPTKLHPLYDACGPARNPKDEG